MTPKRLFDLLCAAIGLLVLLPVMALVALAVWLDSDGPGRDAADVSFATIFGSVGSPPSVISIKALAAADRPWEEPRHREEALSSDALPGLFPATR